MSFWNLFCSKNRGRENVHQKFGSRKFVFLEFFVRRNSGRKNGFEKMSGNCSSELVPGYRVVYRGGGGGRMRYQRMILVNLDFVS